MYICIGSRKNLLREWSMGSSNYVLSILPWSQAVKFVKEHNARFCKSSFFESFSYGRFTFSNKLWEQFGSLFDRKIIGVLIITLWGKNKTKWNYIAVSFLQFLDYPIFKKNFFSKQILHCLGSKTLSSVKQKSTKDIHSFMHSSLNTKKVKFNGSLKK